MLRYILHPSKLEPARDEAFDRFKRSIQLHGQIEPIICARGGHNGDLVVLRGVKRLRACEDLGLEVKSIVLDVADAEQAELIAALKLHREHFTTTKRVLFALRLKPFLEQHAKDRQRQGRVNLPDPKLKGKATEVAGGEWDVSGSYVYRAEQIKLHAPDLYAQLDAEKLNINQAFNALKARQESAERRKLVRALPSKADGASWQIHTGDSIEHLPTLKRRRFPLIVTDPQYNIGLDYGDGIKHDKLPRAEFIKFTETWMRECSELLTPNGTLWAVIGDEWAVEYITILRGLGLHQRAWCKWYETFGQCNSGKTNFSSTSRHLLYFVKDPKNYVWNASGATVESWRQKHGDKRANPAGKMMDDVWVIPRLPGNDKERVPGRPPDIAPQMPIAVIRPMIAACSNIGDEVLDPFSGNATTGCAAVILGRRYYGVEKNSKFADVGRARLTQKRW